HRSANLAGIEDGGNLAVGFLVEPEANRGPIFLGLETMEIAVGDLGEGNADLSTLESYFGRRRKRAHALGVNELRSNHQDEQERTGVHRNHPQAFAAGAPQSLA